MACALPSLSCLTGTSGSSLRVGRAGPSAQPNLIVVRASPGAAAASSSSTEEKGRLVGHVWAAWQQHHAAQQLPAPESTQGLRAQMSSAGHTCMAVALPFASSLISGGGGLSSTGEVLWALGRAIDVYMMVLTVRVLLTWFRGINWISEPFRTLRQFTDPPLSACRGLLPPIGGIDLSPMALFFGMSFLAKQLKVAALSA